MIDIHFAGDDKKKQTARYCIHIKHICYKMIEYMYMYKGVELNVDGMPIHRSGEPRKLTFLNKN